MAVISTKKMFEEYFKDKSDNIKKKVQPQVDRHEVYEFEEKIGKQLVDMSVDELFEMIETFGNNRRKSNLNYKISYGSYEQISSTYRCIFNWYIDNYEVIRNPWNRHEMRGTEATLRLAQSREVFTKEKLDEIIKQIYNEFETERAKYLECILLLFYCGFQESSEIVKIKEENINFVTREIYVGNRTVQLSERCFSLLKYVNSLESIPGWRGVYLAVPYHESYFKFFVRASEVKSLQGRPETEAANLINRRILQDINRKLSLDLNYKLIYYLGFFNYLETQYGNEEATRLAIARRRTSYDTSSKDSQKLLMAAKSYGIKESNVTLLKKNLKPYVK